MNFSSLCLISVHCNSYSSIKSQSFLTKDSLVCCDEVSLNRRVAQAGRNLIVLIQTTRRYDLESWRFDMVLLPGLLCRLINAASRNAYKLFRFDNVSSQSSTVDASRIKPDRPPRDSRLVARPMTKEDDPPAAINAIPREPKFARGISAHRSQAGQVGGHLMFEPNAGTYPGMHHQMRAKIDHERK